MAINPGDHVIRHTLAELAAVEGEAAAVLDLVQQVSAAPAGALAALEGFRPMVAAHRDRLATCLEGLGGAGPGRATMPPPAIIAATTDLPGLVREICLVFHKAALDYVAAFEVALRLFDLPLREIAPGHMKAHADAALATAQLLPGVVAWQLEQEGMHCACICPMCGLGACGCVAYGSQTVAAAWRATAPADAGPPGFVLQPPRPESQLAEAGVQGGDRVLAVDGAEVRLFGEIQSALRQHRLGDEVTLRIRRDGQPAREITVRHVSDYLNR